MEQRSEQLATSGGTTAPTTRPSGTHVFRRTLRLLLRRFLYFLTVILRPLRRYAAFAVVTALLLGVIGWMAFQLWVPAAGQVRDTRAAFLQPSSGVENYIRGQQNFNAELVWASLSSQSQASQLGNGASKQTMQTQLDRYRDIGVRYNRYDYVGGVNLDDGGMMYFYSVAVQLPSQTGQTVSTQVPLTLVVNEDGKVINIISPPLVNNLSTSSQ